MPLCSSFAHREAHSPEIAAAVTQTLSSSMDYDTDYGRVPRQGAHRYIVVNSPFTEITVKVTVNHRRSRYYQVHSTEASVHKVSMNETSTAYTEAPLSSFLHRLRRYTVKLCHRLHRLGIGHAYTVSSSTSSPPHRSSIRHCCHRRWTGSLRRRIHDEGAMSQTPVSDFA